MVDHLVDGAAAGEAFRLSAPGDAVAVLLHPPVRPDGEELVSFDVQLVGSGLDARCAVETFVGDRGLLTRPVAVEGDIRIHREHSLSAYLRQLGEAPKPWDGRVGWRSLGGTFTVETSCDRVGHVTMTIMLEARGFEPPWSISVTANHLLGDLLPLADRLTLWFATHL